MIRRTEIDFHGLEMPKGTVKSSTLNLLFVSRRRDLCKKVRKSSVVVNGERKSSAKVPEKFPPSPWTEQAEAKNRQRPPCPDDFWATISAPMRALLARSTPSAASPQSPHIFNCMHMHIIPLVLTVLYYPTGISFLRMHTYFLSKVHQSDSHKRPYSRIRHTFITRIRK